MRTAPGVSLRPEPFGAVAYVADRDAFFALDAAHARVAHLGDGVVEGSDVDRAATLAALGICRTRPETAERPHHGRSLVGDLAAGPPLDRPLVVNCFSTARCPLACGYCHADDLMVPYRATERWAAVEAVARTGALVPAMVAVVTGGDPIVAPGRAAWLIERLATGKRIVLDTSGAGDIGPLLPSLRRHRVHVRVSLDSADPAVNDRARPTSPAYLPRGASSWAHAHATLARLAEAAVPCSVQTVVGSHNDDLPALLALRDHLVGTGVRHWVLHVAVPAGKAARHPRLLPGPGAVELVREVVRDCVRRSAPIDVRVTGTHRTPSAVLLVDPLGRLCVEGPEGAGKRVIWQPPEHDGGGGDGGGGDGCGGDAAAVLARFRHHVDLAGHASRYLNGTLEAGPQPVPARPGSARSGS